MLPWPTVVPTQIVGQASWQPSPAQQVACLAAGVSLQRCHEPGRTYWMAWASGVGRQVDNWPDVVAFAKSRGVRL